MKHANVFTVFYGTSIVLMLILLYGCAGTTHTQTTQPEPVMTSETHTIVEQRVKNPETGLYEMKVVRKERTKTQSYKFAGPVRPAEKPAPTESKRDEAAD